MLDIVEMESLEKRWLRWRVKSITKRVLLFCVILAFVPICWRAISYFPKSFESKKVLENRQKVDKIASTNEIVVKQIKSKEPLQKVLKKEKVPKKQIKKEVLAGVKDDYVKIEQVDKVYMQEPKSDIKIEISEIKRHSDLRDKFDKTKDIIFALMLAEEHYHDMEYKDALRWSVIANDMDTKNVRSWIIFAKSMAKDGSPQKAILALQEYLNQNPNVLEIKNLIKKIQKGDY